MAEIALASHFFRHEAGKLTAALARLFGWHNLPEVEDIVQDTLVSALETWRLQGVPEAPGAWLMLAARRRAVDAIRRQNVRVRFAPAVDVLLRTEWTRVYTVSEHFEPNALGDAELSAIFACASPAVAPEVQVALILKILCGFSVAEIAHAFMAQAATIEKRITRGKQNLAAAPTSLDTTDIPARLPVVQQALYLLFNEGYHSSHPEETVRHDLCFEAMRLTKLLCAARATATPDSFALCALMCLQAARLSARAVDGVYVALEDQDRSRFDWELISVGLRLLQRSARGVHVSNYHLQAAIAAEHCLAPSFEATDWAAIVGYYDLLCERDDSAILQLNRAIALGQQGDRQRALGIVESLEASGRLDSYPFLFGAQARLLAELGDVGAARTKLGIAIERARTNAERNYFELWLERLRTE
jgi:RNA polymerase sigma-70 factor (ECF subfamily)